jgi:hypothetical protein
MNNRTERALKASRLIEVYLPSQACISPGNQYCYHHLTGIILVINKCIDLLLEFAVHAQEKINEGRRRNKNQDTRI